MDIDTKNFVLSQNPNTETFTLHYRKKFRPIRVEPTSDITDAMAMTDHGHGWMECNGEQKTAYLKRAMAIQQDIHLKNRAKNDPIETCKVRVTHFDQDVEFIESFPDFIKWMI